MQCAVCVSPVLCLHYCSAVCCERKSCVVFALLPVQCAVCVSPMLCLHYCQLICAVCVSPVLCLLNVLPAQFAVQGLQ